MHDKMNHGKKRLIHQTKTVNNVTHTLSLQIHIQLDLFIVHSVSRKNLHELW